MSNDLEKTTEQDNKTDSPRISFIKGLQELINQHSKENTSDTPDFILAQYLNNCLTNFDLALQQRSDWYSG